MNTSALAPAGQEAYSSAQSASVAVRIRAAHEGDIPAILQLVNGFAAERVMLPRTAQSVTYRLSR